MTRKSNAFPNLTMQLQSTVPRTALGSGCGGGGDGGQKMRQEWGGTRRGKGRKEERPGERLKSKWQTVQMKRVGESRLEGSKGFIRGGGREVKGSGRGCGRENEQE